MKTPARPNIVIVLPVFISMARRAALPVSAMTRGEEPKKVAPCGFLKRAFVPKPSAKPAMPQSGTPKMQLDGFPPPPANVETAPLGRRMRRTRFALPMRSPSGMANVPWAEIAKLEIEPNRTLEIAPSVKPHDVPTPLLRVVTIAVSTLIARSRYCV